MSLEKNYIHLTRVWNEQGDTDDIYINPALIHGFTRRRDIKTTLLLPVERQNPTTIILADQRNLEVTETPEQIAGLVESWDVKQ